MPACEVCLFSSATRCTKKMPSYPDTLCSKFVLSGGAPVNPELKKGAPAIDIYRYPSGHNGPGYGAVFEVTSGAIWMIDANRFTWLTPLWTSPNFSARKK